MKALESLTEAIHRFDDKRTCLRIIYAFERMKQTTECNRNTRLRQFRGRCAFNRHGRFLQLSDMKDASRVSLFSKLPEFGGDPVNPAGSLSSGSRKDAPGGPRPSGMRQGVNAE